MCNGAGLERAEVADLPRGCEREGIHRRVLRVAERHRAGDPAGRPVRSQVRRRARIKPRSRQTAPPAIVRRQLGRHRQRHVGGQRKEVNSDRLNPAIDTASSLVPAEQIDGRALAPTTRPDVPCQALLPRRLVAMQPSAGSIRAMPQPS